MSMHGHANIQEKKEKRKKAIYLIFKSKNSSFQSTALEGTILTLSTEVLKCLPSRAYISSPPSSLSKANTTFFAWKKLNKQPKLATKSGLGLPHVDNNKMCFWLLKPSRF